MSNLKIPVSEWHNIGSGTLWSSLGFGYRRGAPINIIVFLGHDVSIGWDPSRSAGAVSEVVSSDTLSGAHVSLIVTFEDVNFVIGLEDGTAGTYHKGNVVTVKECFVMLHAYLSQSNVFSELLLDTEVGRWKVVVVWFCIRIYCFTVARKPGKSLYIATVVLPFWASNV